MVFKLHIYSAYSSTKGAELSAYRDRRWQCDKMLSKVKTRIANRTWMVFLCSEGAGQRGGGECILLKKHIFNN